MKTTAYYLLPASLLMLLAASSAAYATNTVQTLYKCLDESGVTLYTNQKTKDKKCTVLSVQVPGPTAPSKGNTNGSVSPAPTGKSATKTPTPADFPRVTGDDQKSRDGDRRAILDRELANEQANLDKAKQPTAASAASPEARKAWQDSIALHERNIEALNKEISRLR